MPCSCRGADLGLLLESLLCEPLFVLEYVAGHRCGIGQAMPHHDWNCPGKGGSGPEDASDGTPGCPDLRVVTSLIYLNTLPPGWGGGTRLPRAGLRSGARKGACFLWFNAIHTLIIYMICVGVQLDSALGP